MRHMRRMYWMGLMAVAVLFSAGVVTAADSQVFGAPDTASARGLPLDAERFAVPKAIGPFDYVPASPSDELREESGRAVPLMDEAPIATPITDDNMG